MASTTSEPAEGEPLRDQHDAPEEAESALGGLWERLRTEPDPVQAVIDFCLFRRPGKALAAIERAVRRLPEGAESMTAVILRRWRPWRGAAGRAAAGRSKAKGKAGRAARAMQLHLEGLSNKEIAERIGVSTKTVERALKGRRARRRTDAAPTPPTATRAAGSGARAP